MQRPCSKQGSRIYLDFDSQIEGDCSDNDSYDQRRKESRSKKSTYENISTFGSQQNITQTKALHGFLALAISTLPYIALCSWISTLVDSPFLSLVMAKIVIGGVLLLAFLGSLVWRPVIYLNFALPWGIQNHLLHPQLTHSLGTALACIVYMMIFLFLGYHRLETRDL